MQVEKLTDLHTNLHLQVTVGMCWMISFLAFASRKLLPKRVWDNRPFGLRALTFVMDSCITNFKGRSLCYEHGLGRCKESTEPWME